MQRDIPSGGPREKWEVMRESEHFSGRMKDEQKNVVLGRGGSLRKVVNDQKCRHTSQTCTLLLTLRLSVPPLSHPAIQLVHSFILWDLVSMDPFQEGPWSLGTLRSSASTPHR